ncbi:MAG: hypothetical protein KGD68_14840 [Candidatus Lokiarchaeota archaeon]|nr:hypothetical protein [Candidatus Lokiarchaeota archaeon]
MTILDRKKIRPDILKIQDDSFKEQMKFVFQFMELEENKRFNFQKIYKKLLDLNELFFKKKAGMVELYNKFTNEKGTLLKDYYVMHLNIPLYKN